MKKAATLLLLFSYLYGTAQTSTIGAGFLIGRKKDEKFIIVEKVIAGGPAWKAGIKPGDVLYAVDDVSTEGKTSSEVVQMIKGNAGMVRILTVGNDRHKVSVAIAEIKGSCLSGNCINGEGKYFDVDSSTYTGHFLNSKYHGRGKLELTNGERYEGSFADGKFRGKGVYYFKTGSKYEGNWENGKRNGHGILYYTGKNNSYYDGSWKDDKAEGQGKLVYEDGSVLISNFINNKGSGKSTYRFKNNTFFEGTIEADRFTGTIATANGKKFTLNNVLFQEMKQIADGKYPAVANPKPADIAKQTVPAKPATGKKEATDYDVEHIISLAEKIYNNFIDLAYEREDFMLSDGNPYPNLSGGELLTDVNELVSFIPATGKKVEELEKTVNSFTPIFFDKAKQAALLQFITDSKKMIADYKTLTARWVQLCKSKKVTVTEDVKKLKSKIESTSDRLNNSIKVIKTDDGEDDWWF